MHPYKVTLCVLEPNQKLVHKHNRHTAMKLHFSKCIHTWTHSDRKWHFSKCIHSRTHTRIGNYTLANASTQEQTHRLKTTLEQKHPYKNRHKGREFHFNQSTHTKLHSVFQSQSSTPWTLLRAISLDRWTDTLRLRPPFHVLLDHRTMKTDLGWKSNTFRNTTVILGCYAIPLLSWSITQYQWCAMVLCNTTVVLEYCMIPMVYQGVMQYHCCPGVPHNTNGVSGCCVIPLLFLSVMQYHC